MKDETIILVFKDGTRFTWNCKSLKDDMKAIKLSNEKDNPAEVIGDGATANILRKKYAQMEQQGSYQFGNKEIIDDASTISGINKDILTQRYNKFHDKLKNPFKKIKGGELNE